MRIEAPTWHNEAKRGDFAPTVLMPGDPRRAEHIARHYLSDVREINRVRGMLAFTGTRDGVPVSVMASGMGAPSIGIYATELFEAYGVENIIRVGTSGKIAKAAGVGCVVAATGALTDIGFAAQYGFCGQLAPVADYRLTRFADDAARARGIPMLIGPVFTSDVLYPDDDALPGYAQNLAAAGRMGALVAEMETAALYLIAMRAGRRALALLTVTDDEEAGVSLSPADRETTLDHMVTLALDTALLCASHPL